MKKSKMKKGLFLIGVIACVTLSMFGEKKTDMTSKDVKQTVKIENISLLQASATEIWCEGDKGKCDIGEAHGTGKAHVNTDK